MAGLIYGGLDLMSTSYKAGADSDFGAFEPVTTSLQSLFLDGSYVSGKFADNREIELFVRVVGTSATDTAALTDALVAQADRQTNTLVYTPPSGLPITFDTFRAVARDERRWPGRTDKQRLVSLTIPALPFGRTATNQTITVSGTSPIVFENFNGTQPALTASNNTPVLVQLPTGYGWAGAPKEGTYYGSTETAYGGTMMTVPASSTVWWQLAKTIASTDTTGRTILSFWYLEYFMSQVYTPAHGFTVTATLSSSGASSTWTLSPSWPLPYSEYGKWQKVTFDTNTTPSSTTGGGVNRSAVTGVTIRVTWTNDSTSATTSAICLDLLQLVPPGYGDVSSTMANAYAMDGVQGSARTPVSLVVSRAAGGQMTDLLVYSKPREASSTYQPLLVGSSPYRVAKTNDLGGTYAVVATIVPAYQYAATVACSIQQLKDVTNYLSVANAGFETALTGFWNVNSGTLAQSTTQKHSGTYALRWTPTGSNTLTLASPAYNSGQQMTTPFGASVTFSAWIRSTTTSHSYTAYVSFYRSTGAQSGGFQGTATATTSGWTQITASGTAPTDTLYDRMVVQLVSADAPASGDYQYVDDVVVSGTDVRAGTAWASGDVTYATGDHFVILGEVTLPIVGGADENNQTGYLITTTTNPTYLQDYLLLDTRGQMVMIGPAGVTPFTYARISSPATGQGTGQVSIGDLSDGTDGLSPGSSLRLSGGQLSFEPGSNTLVVVTTAGNSDTALTATYQPRWLTERTA